MSLHGLVRRYRIKRTWDLNKGNSFIYKYKCSQSYLIQNMWINELEQIFDCLIDKVNIYDNSCVQ